MKSIIAIRTNRWSKDLQNWIYQLKAESARMVLVVADETKNHVDIPSDIEKISISDDFLERKGLFSTEKIMWRCGDYSLIAVYSKFKDADFFWLLDDDARISSVNLDNFFTKFENSGYDFLAPEFRRCEDLWSWTKTVKWYAEISYGCFFPLTFYSSNAVKTIYRDRKQLTETMVSLKMPPDMWPNDEAFTATAVVQAGLKAASFNQIQENCIMRENFYFGGLPISEEEFKNILPNERAYHPVLSGKIYYDKVIHSLEEICKTKTKAEDIEIMFSRIFSNIDKHKLPIEYSDLVHRHKIELDSKRAAFLQGTATREQPREIYKIMFQKEYNNGTEVSFFVENPSDYIEAYITRGSFYERECLLIIGDVFPNGGSFLDIGAYNGNHSIYVGFALNAKHIYVCEANPKMAKLCAMNMCLNKLYDRTDFRGLGVALSDTEGRANIYYQENNAGSAVLHSFNEHESHIPVVRGDDLYRDCSIDLIKIDVGDRCVNVIRGLSGTIMASEPTLIVQHASAENSEILHFLSQFGYELFRSLNPYDGQKISVYTMPKKSRK